MARNFRDPEWIAKHPNFISNPPVPSLKRYQPQIPDPELVPHRDWDEWALRAWVEKRRLKEKTDAAWRKRQDEIGRCLTLTMTLVVHVAWPSIPQSSQHCCLLVC